MFSLKAVKFQWAVGFAVILGFLCIFALFSLLMFYVLASLPSELHSRFKFPWKYTPEKKTLMFASQLTSILFAIGASLCLLFSYFIEDVEEMKACQVLQEVLAFFSLGLELVQTIFLLQKAKLTKNVWGKCSLSFYRTLYAYVLISYPILIILMMVYVQGSFITTDDGSAQLCGASVPAEIAGAFAFNSIVTNGSLFSIFYRSINSVAVTPTRTSTSDVLTPAEKQARLMKVARRNLISFCVISFSLLLFLLAALMPGGNLGLASAGYLHIHFLVTNLSIMYCTQAAWKKMGDASKSPNGSGADKDKNVSTKPRSASTTPIQTSIPEK
jgi:hypothetical protein